MMQRPVKRLIDVQNGFYRGIDGENDEDYGEFVHKDEPKIIDSETRIWNNLQLNNLKSALAFSALTTPNNAEERILYENIV